jgi:hypothetical protein
MTTCERYIRAQAAAIAPNRKKAEKAASEATAFRKRLEVLAPEREKQEQK